MRTVAFHSRAFDQYSEWATTDPALFARLHRLIVETAKTPFAGLGKPEPLKHELKGYWSRRINDEHRMVYKIEGGALLLAQLRYHY